MSAIQGFKVGGRTVETFRFFLVISWVSAVEGYLLSGVHTVFFAIIKIYLKIAKLTVK